MGGDRVIVRCGKLWKEASALLSLGENGETSLGKAKKGGLPSWQTPKLSLQEKGLCRVLVGGAGGWGAGVGGRRGAGEPSSPPVQPRLLSLLVSAELGVARGWWVSEDHSA